MQASSASSARPPEGSTAGPSSAPVKPPVVQPGIGNNIIVNPCQRGNPVLECIKGSGKEFGDILSDYQVGRTTGVLYLRLHPEYIHQRIERLGTAFNLRILLVLCDVSEHQDSIRELTKICLINNITVIVAWTLEEAGFYLSTFKQFEHKPPTLIKERVDKDYESMMRTALTSINKVNKTDVEILRTSIGSFADIARTPADRLMQLPGFGQVKVKRIKDAFEKPFRGAGAGVLPFASQQRPAGSEGSGAVDARLSAKGKARARAEESTPGPAPRPPRSPSPVWDLELDLNTPPPDELPPPPAPQPRKRPPSPVWDIELDLNPSDVEEETARKRHKSVHPEDGGDDDGFGTMDLLR
ncbi:DNA repair protein rad1 [Phanerochaete sordida]|uniref:DNA repair protein rad1 n=1 Tax=Phanerochaete sordida TaxID=48140 RepID=A0A9P3GH06_9APHY|nr:DNA repair protein rad1 [Phanerochaete sordida]